MMKKIKEKPTLPTSIGNTVARTAIFKPDAGYRNGEKDGWNGERSQTRESREAQREKCGLS